MANLPVPALSATSNEPFHLIIDELHHYTSYHPNNDELALLLDKRPKKSMNRDKLNACLPTHCTNLENVHSVLDVRTLPPNCSAMACVTNDKPDPSDIAGASTVDG